MSAVLPWSLQRMRLSHLVQQRWMRTLSCGPDTGSGGCSVEALPDAVEMYCISPAGRSGVGGSVTGAAMAELATWVALFSRASAAESFRTAVEAAAGCFSQALLPPST